MFVVHIVTQRRASKLYYETFSELLCIYSTFCTRGAEFFLIKVGKFLKKLLCYISGGYYRNYLVSSTELIMTAKWSLQQVSKLTFQAIALQQME